MAFTSVAALVAGSQAVTATLVLAAVAEVGIAMTVVGAVTGSKDLMKIGGTLSLVGGIGGMIAGAVGGAAAGTAAIAGPGDAAWGMDLGTDAVAGLGDAAAGAAESAVASGIPGGAAVGEALPDLGMAPAMNPTDMRLADGTQTTPGIVDQARGVEAAATVNDIVTPSAPSVQPTATPYTSTLGSRGTAPASSGSFWNSFTNFANNNKTLFSGGLQLLGGAMKGMNDSRMWDQRMALEQQRLDQTSHGSEVANFAPRPTGIIAGARS